MKAALVRAELVWDGGFDVAIPAKIGTPCADQMVGTTGEKLIELMTRLCYDSLGVDENMERKGRSTSATLGNVMEVYHGSVLEHYVRTVELGRVPGATEREHLMMCFAGRPGASVRMKLGNTMLNEVSYRITINTRAVVEWDQWSAVLLAEHGLPAHSGSARLWACLGERLREKWSRAVPLIVKYEEKGGEWPVWLITAPFEFVEPETDSEKHITLYLVGSRGFSHEMVRHRFAMSQRSTRYCEEGASPWQWHPLIHQFIAEHPHIPVFEALLNQTQEVAQTTYTAICNELQEWLAKKLPEDTPYRKKHARKQARGAARGFQGNALETQMGFTAPVWGWRHIANMRAADAADAEIRVVISDAVPCLKASRYGDRFADMNLVLASDGMGWALEGGGHK